MVFYTHEALDLAKVTCENANKGYITLNAYSSIPIVSPGSGSYLVPAFANTASFVVRPGVFLAATLTPATISD